MSLISQIDTSFYPELVEGFAPKSTLPIPALNSESSSSNLDSHGSYKEEPGLVNFNLNDYYNQVSEPADLLSKSGQYLAQAGKKLDNSMVIAMQNGYSIQDVCNIRLAEQAYKASAYVFDVAEEISTFALDV